MPVGGSASHLMVQSNGSVAPLSSGSTVNPSAMAGTKAQTWPPDLRSLGSSGIFLSQSTRPALDRASTPNRNRAPIERCRIRTRHEHCLLRKNAHLGWRLCCLAAKPSILRQVRDRTRASAADRAPDQPVTCIPHRESTANTRVGFKRLSSDHGRAQYRWRGVRDEGQTSEGR